MSSVRSRHLLVYPFLVCHEKNNNISDNKQNNKQVKLLVACACVVTCLERKDVASLAKCEIELLKILSNEKYTAQWAPIPLHWMNECRSFPPGISSSSTFSLKDRCSEKPRANINTATKIIVVVVVVVVATVVISIVYSSFWSILKRHFCGQCYVRTSV